MQTKTIAFTDFKTAQLLDVETKPIISRVVKPEQAPEIYTQLCDDPLFPMGTVFDWRA